MGVTAIATVLGLPLAFLMPSMRRKMGMKKMVIYGFAFSALGYLLIFFAGRNMILVIVAGLITSIGVVPFTMMFNIFIVDCADYNELKGIPRMEGTMGSLTGLAGKIGSAFGGFILGILMSLSGYDGGTDRCRASDDPYAGKYCSADNLCGDHPAFTKVFTG